MMPVFYLKQLFPKKNQEENKTKQKRTQQLQVLSSFPFFSSTCAETGSTHKVTIINTRRLVYT